MGDRVSYYDEGKWDNSEGTIVGFICIDKTPYAVIRTVNGSYIHRPIDSIRYIS